MLVWKHWAGLALAGLSLAIQRSSCVFPLLFLMTWQLILSAMNQKFLVLWRSELRSPRTPLLMHSGLGQPGFKRWGNRLCLLWE